MTTATECDAFLENLISADYCTAQMREKGTREWHCVDIKLSMNLYWMKSKDVNSATDRTKKKDWKYKLKSAVGKGSDATESTTQLVSDEEKQLMKKWRRSDGCITLQRTQMDRNTRKCSTCLTTRRSHWM